MDSPAASEEPVGNLDAVRAAAATVAVARGRAFVFASLPPSIPFLELEIELTPDDSAATGRFGRPREELPVPSFLLADGSGGSGFSQEGERSRFTPTEKALRVAAVAGCVDDPTTPDLLDFVFFGPLSLIVPGKGSHRRAS